MTLFKVITRATYISLCVIICSCKAQYPDLEDGLYAEFITSKGTMVAKLAHDKTPATVANFIALAEGTNTMVDSTYEGEKFYNGLKFHRVVNDFMIQGGDPLGNGSGNPGYKFDDEFDKALRHNKKGVLAMANSGYGTNGSQFYITHKETPWLDAYDKNDNLKKCANSRVSCHTVFGEVLLGIEIVDSIKQDDVIVELNIIRKGKEAKSFDASKLFKNHFIEAEKRKKEKAEKAEAILKTTKDKFSKQKEKAISLPSGLQYTITQDGSGEKLPNNAKVLTHYTVYFENGKLLETSKLETAEALDVVDESRKTANGYTPIKADIGPDAKMIPGFKEGLQQLSVGDKATLFIPYHLAYGESGYRNIPGKSNIIFEVEVIKLVK